MGNARLRISEMKKAAAVIFIFSALVILCGIAEGLTVYDCQKKMNLMPIDWCAGLPDCSGPNINPLTTSCCSGSQAGTSYVCVETSVDGCVCDQQPCPQAFSMQRCVSGYSARGFIEVGEITLCFNYTAWGGGMCGEQQTYGLHTECKHDKFFLNPARDCVWSCQAYNATFNCETHSAETVPVGNPVNSGSCDQPNPHPYPTLNDLPALLNEACPCINGETKPCPYTGPAGTEGVGICKAGTQTCANGQWGACQGEVLPSAEICDGKDNNCNGQIDEGFDVGAACSVGVGVCKRDGVMVCSSDGTGTVCSATPGTPSPEICDGIDNDCNGVVDDLPPQPCYSGPAGTENVGICKAGVQTCANGQWGACQGEITPQKEICGDGLDNNCDGRVDEGCVACVDNDGDGHYAISPSCPQGDDCDDNDPTVYPGAPELCDGKDHNCNGQVDEGCTNLKITLNPDKIYPNETGSPVSSIVTAYVTGNNGNPISGQQVNFETEIIESKGHSHNNTRSPGTIGGWCVTDSDGTCSVNYYASLVAGRDKITAYLSSMSDVMDSKEITVRVPNLSPLAGSIVYNLTGASPGSAHPSNHYGTPSTNENIENVAFDYLYETDAMLGINDMSLEWGGLFDIDADWSPPHSLHKVGNSVDIDKKAQDTNTRGYVDVDIGSLTDIVKDYNGWKIPEATIHYEFP